jgi:hypothetical protein
MTCPSCGAALRSGTSWCGQCFAPVAAGVAAAAPSARPVVEQELPAYRTYSRWRKTTTTFGPVGRVLWTLGVVLLMALSLFSQNPFAIAPLCFVLPPLVLRSVWAKGRLT